MPRKIPKWRQSSTSPNRRALKAKFGFNKRTGVGPELIAQLKRNTASDQLFELLSEFRLTSEQVANIQGEPFPASLSSVFSTALKFGPSTLANEIIWAVISILPNGKRIKGFIQQKELFEVAILSGNEGCAAEILSRIESNFGWSVWYMQNTLANAQYRDGVEVKRQLSAIYEKEIHENTLLSMLLYFMAKRIEGTAVPGYLQSELASHFEGVAYRFLKAKLFDVADPEIDALALTLSIDSHFSAIDYYESLVSALQAIAVNEELAATVATVLSRPAQALYRSTSDRRLVPILLAFGVTDTSLYNVISSKCDFIEAYSQGKYEEALQLADLHLGAHVYDMGALVMRIRAELKVDSVTPRSAGLIGEITQHLRNVISLSPDTYSSALSLYALHDRFYGHSWATFLRGVVTLELASDKFEYPSIALRRLIVLESQPTPFTALIQPFSDSYYQLIRYFTNRRIYTSTIEVFRLATNGASANPSSISEERRRRYLGSYELAKSNYEAAIDNFEWLVANSTGADSLRASAAAAIAYSRSGHYSKSVELLVTGYLKWPHAPTALPLFEIVSKLELPENWPENIYLPLAFELYTSYFSNDKLTHLRYAFERFQTDFNILSPTDLKNRASEFGLNNVIFYLNNVWRPEVMRQTVLYEGTREIEEERIKVCQVLAEIDSSNSLRYLAEIRERVKTLEIAKATNLVEQSKVYVDIAAIKKALRSKLGDAYARYKSASPAMAADNSLMETISDILSKSSNELPISQFFSMLHILNPQTASELDLQFAAMFAEVTNEFLRGDHGLNAYLSTRVRHGKLSNALRKPAADEFLVTERKEGSSSYVPNYHWAQTLSGLEKSEHEELSLVLEGFATTLDSIIAHVKDDLIQVKVTHELVSKDSNRQALFYYQTSNLERMYMQASDAKVKSLDEFIDLCIEALWDKTDANLLHVQQVLRTNIRQQLMSAFDELLRALSSLSFSDRLGELYNHIYRARTSTQTQLSNVTSWFKRSEVYDRQDYSIEFPVLIATNMIRNSISGAGDWEGVQLNIPGAGGIMPGRSLDAMVDMFCVLFENAIGHSGESLQNLKVVGDLEFIDGYFRVTLTNSVFARTYGERDESRLQRIRAELAKDDTRNKAQKEGRSGFHKLWAIINAPQYRDPSLEFGFTEKGTFEVKVNFKMEVADEENAYS